MELEEMKILWTTVSENIDNQSLLTDNQIIDMTKEKYHKRIQKISTYETLGAVACFGMALGIVLNMDKLDTWYLVFAGIISLIILVLVPLLTLTALWRMERIDIQANQMKETLIEFSKRRNHFLFMQRLGIYLSFLLMLTALPVAGKIMSNKDILMDSSVWQWYIPAGVVFLFLFARWGYKCYANITSSAENILKEWDTQ